MSKYVALFRGINVGGKNKVSMSVLKAAFEAAGFAEIRTYINSGNVVFRAEGEDAMTLQQMCRQIIVDTFGLDILTAVFSAEEYAEALNHAPDWWGNNAESKHNAIFVIKPVLTAEVIEEVGETKPGYEQVESYGQVIFWSAPIKTFSQTRWSQVVSARTLYNSITIRNANTAKKLLHLLGDEKP